MSTIGTSPTAAGPPPSNFGPHVSSHVGTYGGRGAELGIAEAAPGVMDALRQYTGQGWASALWPAFRAWHSEVVVDGLAAQAPYPDLVDTMLAMATAGLRVAVAREIFLDPLRSRANRGQNCSKRPHSCGAVSRASSPPTASRSASSAASTPAQPEEQAPRRRALALGHTCLHLQRSHRDRRSRSSACPGAHDLGIHGAHGIWRPDAASSVTGSPASAGASASGVGLPWSAGTGAASAGSPAASGGGSVASGSGAPRRVGGTSGSGGAASARALTLARSTLTVQYSDPPMKPSSIHVARRQPHHTFHRGGAPRLHSGGVARLTGIGGIDIGEPVPLPPLTVCRPIIAIAIPSPSESRSQRPGSASVAKSPRRGVVDPETISPYGVRDRYQEKGVEVRTKLAVRVPQRP